MSKFHLLTALYDFWTPCGCGVGGGSVDGQNPCLYSDPIGNVRWERSSEVTVISCRHFSPGGLSFMISVLSATFLSTETPYHTRIRSPCFQIFHKDIMRDISDVINFWWSTSSVLVIRAEVTLLDGKIKHKVKERKMLASCSLLDEYMFTSRDSLLF